MSFRAPTGTSDFAQLRRGNLVYVDKSSLIAEILDDGAQVLLLPRPRRFGKTTNLSMLRYFLQRTVEGEDRSDLFTDLAVWGADSARQHFQKYPVIFLTLKELKPASWEECRADIGVLLSECFAEHRWLLTSDHIDEEERAQFTAMLQCRAGPEHIKRALLLLSRLLHRATGQPVVILIDEYDTPLHAGWLSGYYQDAVDFFRAFLGAGLKDNSHLFKAVLTGILRIAKESIFSDLNNLTVYTLLRDRYSTAFGFTEAEVADLAAQAGASQHLPQIRRWYNGYRFGSATIYNPWSVLNFLASEDFVARSYWANTSTNELVGRLLTSGDPHLSREMEGLLQGGKVRKPIEEGLVLPDLERRSDPVWTLLLWSGYLKASAVHKGGREATLAIPNHEIRGAYDTLLQRWMQNSVGGSAEVADLLAAMLGGDVQRFQGWLQKLVMEALSFHDVGGRKPERVYHAFALGLLVHLRSTHRVESNLESGFGRADILVIPRKAGRPGVVLEFKSIGEQEASEGALESAVTQIEDRAYVARLEEAGSVPVRRYGIVFDGKRVLVRMG